MIVSYLRRALLYIPKAATFCPRKPVPAAAPLPFFFHSFVLPPPLHSRFRGLIVHAPFFPFPFSALVPMVPTSSPRQLPLSLSLSPHALLSPKKPPRVYPYTLCAGFLYGLPRFFDMDLFHRRALFRTEGALAFACLLFSKGAAEREREDKFRGFFFFLSSFDTLSTPASHPASKLDRSIFRGIAKTRPFERSRNVFGQRVYLLQGGGQEEKRVILPGKRSTVRVPYTNEATPKLASRR